MCSFCWQKCGPRLKLFFRLEIFSTFRGVHTLIFTYVLYIFIGLQEEPANFYWEKRSVTIVTGHLFTFLTVLSLICSVTTQILVSENQTIWRLKILLRTIVTALLITKCNGRFVKKKNNNKKISRNGQGIFHNSGNDRKRAIFDTWLCQTQPTLHPTNTHTHTHTNKKDTVCLMISAHPTSSPHKFFFQFPSRRMQSFLITQLPKNKMKNFIP